ncbi:MAG: phytanoyl-CoA dioxygenase family protein [Planctomycetes bacterium]|nr:phytanoyl-CoA dioxygenase family protein [Planctomycetota bacterium]
MSLLQQLTRDGYALLPETIDAATIARLAAALETAPCKTSRRRDGTDYAARNLLADVPAITESLTAPRLLDAITSILGLGAFAVRAILFDKVQGANWLVGWHQDRAIAVREKRDTPGFGPWSVKAGVPHVQPPADVMERMLTVRLHLDDTPPDNGPLRVSPGTHRLGSIDGGDISDIVARHGEKTLAVPAGGAVLMRPLLLHASSPATDPSHRRVIHVELAAFDLPGDLAWHDRVAITAG